MSTRLPAFSGLIAFYAAVRHGTLTGAARELNVSQPAITRRIAALEADLGCSLFDRSHKPAPMTQQGRELMRALRSGFGQIETVVDQLRRGSGKRVVTVAGPSGFVGFWLIPRLADLETAFPEMEIRIISREHSDSSDPGDITITFGHADPEASPETGQPTKILGEQVFPAASPLYLSRVGTTADRFDFSAKTLLSMQTTRRHWHDWPSWFDTMGEPMPRDTRQLDFNSYAMLINAALAGQGVCLCWSGLLDNFIEAGALIRLSDRQAVSQRGYFISLRDGLAARPEVTAIRDWIIGQGTA